MHKEVARNAPALHAGPLAFFYEKSLAKKLFICLGSPFFPLSLLLVRGSRLSCSLFWCRCVYRELMAKEIAQLANPKRTLRILANEWLVQRITNCTFLFLVYSLYILLLCVHKEVARNAPALHAGPLAFFYEKSLAKKLFICLGSSFFPLLLLLVRGSRLFCSLFWCRCNYRELYSIRVLAHQL